MSDAHDHLRKARQCMLDAVTHTLPRPADRAGVSQALQAARAWLKRAKPRIKSDHVAQHLLDVATGRYGLEWASAKWTTEINRDNAPPPSGNFVGCKVFGLPWFFIAQAKQALNMAIGPEWKPELPIESLNPLTDNLPIMATTAALLCTHDSDATTYRAKEFFQLNTTKGWLGDVMPHLQGAYAVQGEAQQLMRFGAYGLAAGRTEEAAVNFAAAASWQMGLPVLIANP